LEPSGEFPPMPTPEELAGDDMGGVSSSGDPFKDNPQLEEMLEDRIEMHEAYCSTFKDVRVGRKVLKHLKKLHSFKGDSLYSWQETHADTAFKLGQRHVIESIERFLDTEPDEFKDQILAQEEQRQQQERLSYGRQRALELFRRTLLAPSV